MARRSDHTKDELKDLILSASRKIIEKEGFQNLSARNIAKNIKYTPGTLYNFFKNLDGLILQINAETLDLLYEELLKVTSNIKNKKQVINNICKCYIDFSYKHFNFWSMLYEHHFPRPEGEKLPKWYQDKIYRIFNLIEEALLPFTKNNKKESEHLSKVLWASLHGICILSLTRKLNTVSAGSMPALTDSFAKIFTNGIKSKQ